MMDLKFAMHQGKTFMSEKMGEFAPRSAIDWTKILLSVLVAAFSLLIGRVWGESVIAGDVGRNQVRVSVLERRLDDHMTTASAQQQQLLTELRAIRNTLSGRQ